MGTAEWLIPALCLITLSIGLSLIPAPTRGQYGGVDGNQKIEVSDAVLVLRSIVGCYIPALEELLRGDFTFNGQLDVPDAVGILRIVVGLP